MYKYHDTAIKQPLRRYSSDAACGLAATQAMATLGEGVRRLSSWHRFDTARPYACLVAGPNAPDQTISTMMMSYVKGTTPTTVTVLPNSEKRHKLYDAAALEWWRGFATKTNASNFEAFSYLLLGLAGAHGQL